MNNRIIAVLIACAMVTAGCSNPAIGVIGGADGPTDIFVAGKADCGPAPQSPNSGVTPSAQEVDRDTIYTVQVDNYVDVSFDADGNVVQPVTQDDGITLSDVLTGEPRYRMHTKTEDTGKDNEWGSPIVRDTTALYDLDGKLLYDYGDYTYDSAVGGLLVRKEHRGHWASIDDVPADFFSELWDPQTGKSVQPKVERLEPLDKDKGTVAALDVFGNLLCTMDASGQLLQSIDKGYRCEISGNRVIVSNTSWDVYDAADEQYTLMDTDLTPITTAQYLSSRTTWDAYGLMMYRDNGNVGMMNRDGVKLFAMSTDVGQYFDFCDGELLIMNLAEGGAVLLKLDGTQIGEKYDRIAPICPDEYRLTEPPAQFAAQLGSTISIIDRQGKVVRSGSLPEGGSIDSAGDKYIVYRTEAGFSGLMDIELNTVMAADKYDSLRVAKQYNGNDSPISYDIIIAQYYPRTTEEGQKDYSYDRVDIYDADMNLIIDSLSTVGTVGMGRIAVVRGFSAGIIDWQGNWIGKTSIFQIAGDERKVEIF